MARVPRPGDGIALDHTPAAWRAADEDDSDRARDARYWAAMHADMTRRQVDAVTRLADSELAEVRGLLALRSDALNATAARAEKAEAERNDARKAIERAMDLAEVWEGAEPMTMMSRRRAAAILREVLA
jgi:hypothetical protein